MNNPTRRQVLPGSRAQRVAAIASSLAIAALPLVIAVPGGALAAPAGADAGAFRAKTQVTFDNKLLQYENRPPIEFKPLPMVDLKTGLPIAPTAMIVLKNGTRTTAQEYYAGVNQFEQWLNQHGYSLRTAPKGGKIELARIPVNEALLREQVRSSTQPTDLGRRPDLSAAAIAKSGQAVRPVRLDPNGAAVIGVRQTLDAKQIADIDNRITAAGIQSVTLHGLAVSQTALAQIGAMHFSVGPVLTPNKIPNCTPMQGSKSWTWNAGASSDPFNAYITGNVAFQGNACQPPNMNNYNQNASKFEVTAEGKAGGKVFGAGGDVLRLTGDLKGDASANTVTADFEVFVAGQSVYSVNKTSPSWSWSPAPLQKSVDFSAGTTIWIGPVPVALQIGAHGDAGLQYSLNLTPMEVSLSGGPFVHSSVYAQAGVGVSWASAGVGVQMTLIDWDMNLHASAGVGWCFGYYAYDDLYADSDVNMLAGNLYAYAEVDTWFGDAEYTHNLFSWDGLHYNSVLFNQAHSVALGW